MVKRIIIGLCAGVMAAVFICACLLLALVIYEYPQYTVLPILAAMGACFLIYGFVTLYRSFYEWIKMWRIFSCLTLLALLVGCEVEIESRSQDSNQCDTLAWQLHEGQKPHDSIIVRWVGDTLYGFNYTDGTATKQWMDKEADSYFVVSGPMGRGCVEDDHIPTAASSSGDKPQ